MDKNQISQGTHAGVLSNTNRQPLWTRVFLLALFLALSLASLQPGASAGAADQSARGNKASLYSHQPTGQAFDCSACEEGLVMCLARGEGPSCGAQYDACLRRCQ
jgi:hypothetical protein